jgi:hypothetical protein
VGDGAAWDSQRVTIPAGPYPSVGLYWFDNTDPTVGNGMAAPLGQLLIREDVPSVYYKNGPGNTDWIKIGNGTPGINGITVENQGADIGGNPHQILNFVGAGVTASDAGGGVATITIPGGEPIASVTTTFDDFLDDRRSFLSVAGGGAIGGGGSDMGNNAPGTYTQTVTAASTDVARILAARGDGATASLYFGGGVVVWENRHQIPTLSGGAQRIDLRVGMHDGLIGAPTNGVWIEYSLALNGSQNYFLCAASAGVTTKVDTGIAAIAGANRKVRITVNAAGSSASVTIDGVAGAAPVAANIPVIAANNTFAANLQVVKALGATDLTVIHDYYWIQQTFTTPR